MNQGEHSHIVSGFDNDLAQLERKVLEMGGLAEAQLRDAMEALVRQDVEVAENIIRRDSDIDECERKIEASALSIIARRQPMANDLRYVFGNVKIAGSLERIGDYAKNIAKRSLILTRADIQIPHDMAALGNLAQRTVRDVMDSFTTRDAHKAEMVWQHDHELDDLVARVMRQVISRMSQDLISSSSKAPEEVECSTHLLFVTKNLERVGDHATNIAEVIQFQLSGGWKTGERPKGGDSLQVVGRA
ncbi:MAG: phosphate signaling complex protein PhoU [Proteobacteria bacterium]|nr:phosphate signaling complex protein PhoU [Pseudomonadota bacterium]